MPDGGDELVVLTTASSELQAALWVGVLESHGIAAMGPTSAATTLRWEVSGSDPFKIYVRRRDVERAREALDRDRADSVDIDWDEVDTGDTEPEPRDDGGRGRGSIVTLICGAVVVLALMAVLAGLLQAT